MTAAARLAATLAIAAAGGLLAMLLGLPVAWLLGSATAVVVAALLGLDTRLPDALRNLAFFVLGIQAGAGVTPDVVDQLTLWPLSFAIQMAGVGCVVAGTYAFLRRGFGWDKETALFASLPGALSFVLAAASETRADMTRITAVQSVRLLLILGALTPMLAWLGVGDNVSAAGRGSLDGTPGQYALLLGSCLLASGIGYLSRVPGGMMLGALIASAVLHATQLAPLAVPSSIGIPALVVLGALIGGRLKREDRAVLLQLLPASIGAFAIGLALSAVAAALAFEWLGIGFGKIALAYAPGALEAMTVLSYQFDQDPAYVAAHHVVRFVCIALLVPLLAKRMSRRVSFGANPKDLGVDRGED